MVRRIKSQAQNCQELALRLNRLLYAMLAVYEYSQKNLKNENENPLSTNRLEYKGGFCIL